VYTCTRPFARPLTDRVHGSVRAAYTAVYRRCSRPLQGRVRVVNTTCTYMALVHGRVCTRPVYTAHTRPCTSRVHVPTAVYMAYTYTARVHGRVCTRPVYAARTRPSTRPCIGRVLAVYTAGVHSRVHDHVRVHGRVHGCVHGPCTARRPCTCRGHGRVHDCVDVV